MPPSPSVSSRGSFGAVGCFRVNNMMKNRMHRASAFPFYAFTVCSVSHGDMRPDMHGAETLEPAALVTAAFHTERGA